MRGPHAGSGPTVHVYTSSALQDGRAAAGIVIRDAAGRTLRIIPRPVRAHSREEAAYRAVLHGVWRARTLGARRIRVFSDNAAVVAQVNGEDEVAPPLTGVYLQTRAMLNAYRWSSVEWIPRERNAEAALAALDALDREPEAEGLVPELAEPLPLWEAAGAAAQNNSSPWVKRRRGRFSKPASVL